MDTRFWGPSGWKLLHLATFTYDPSNASSMRKFLQSLPYILPCKFCRASLTDYYDKHPFEHALKSRDELIKWLYTIHNEVNGKLRSQGLISSKNPSLNDVKLYYTQWIATSTPVERLSIFWNFLFSVAYCHPFDTAKTTKPMPNCPKFANTCKSKKIRNRWNTLNASDRLPFYKQFWHTLPDIMEPSIAFEWKSALKTTHPDIHNRRATIAWLWRMRCALDKDFHDPYTHVCKHIASYSSDCSKTVSSRSKTCRKKRM